MKNESVISYDANAKYYEEKFRRIFEEYAKPDVERFVAELKGPKVLDMGCGPGIYLEYFREQGLDALGVDLSEAFLARCAEKGLNVRKMDMEKPLLYPYAYHGIWSVALVHVPHQRMPELVKTWAKLLKPNGILFVSVKKGEGEGFVPSATGDNTKRWVTHFSEAQVEKYFSTHFEVIHGYTRTLEHGNEWIAYLFRLKPPVQKRQF